MTDIRLDRLPKSRRLKKAREVEKVKEMRRAGMSWSEIGKVFGVSRQSVWERFAVACRDVTSEV